MKSLHLEVGDDPRYEASKQVRRVVVRIWMSVHIDQTAPIFLLPLIEQEVADA